MWSIPKSGRHISSRAFMDAWQVNANKVVNSVKAHWTSMEAGLKKPSGLRSKMVDYPNGSH
jgi:hypothetical protein